MLLIVCLDDDSDLDVADNLDCKLLFSLTELSTVIVSSTVSSTTVAAAATVAAAEALMVIDEVVVTQTEEGTSRLLWATWEKWQSPGETRRGKLSMFCFFLVFSTNFWSKSVPEAPGNLADHFGPVWASPDLT